MSGTSMDGIDAALVDLSGEKPNIVKAKTFSYAATLKNRLIACANGSLITPDEIAELDVLTGQAFADACNELIVGISNEKICAIGSHGQTVCHCPDNTPGFTLQLGCPSQITEKTNITTISDFRRRDIAAGGQGAPLMSAFHKECFYSEYENQLILNIGGIANITYLSKKKSDPLIGFDSGPGNCLMDRFIFKVKGEPFDHDGSFASQGRINEDLLNKFFNDQYFSLRPPKSTGTNYFNDSWLEEKLKDLDVSKNDVQATLLQLTVSSISSSIQKFCYPYPSNIFVCGGGANNKELIKQLKKAVKCEVSATNRIGIEAEWVEAAGFAWLAKKTLSGKPGNSPDVTGSSGYRILGTICPK